MSDEKTDRDEAPKKERVLHTRVPAVLEEELKRLATALRMPVSNLVRAVLEDAVDAVDAASERAEGELKGMVSRIHQQRETLRGAVQQPLREKTAKVAEPAKADEPACPDSSPQLDGIVGVQRLTLITDSTCTVCGRALPRGSEACRGVRDEPGPTSSSSGAPPRTQLLLGPRCGLLPGER